MEESTEERREKEAVGGLHGGGASGVLKVSLCMLLVQLFQTGMAVMSKLALNQGMCIFPFLVYRNAIGAFCVSCFALVMERNNLRKLSWRGLGWISMNAFTGLTLAMGLYYYGLRDTSAAYSSIFLNLIPVATFILSVILRVEKLGLGDVSGVAKVLGTLVCVGGAMVISLYRGKVLHVWPFHFDITHELPGMKGSIHNLPRGTSFLVGSCISYAFWFILQVKMFKAFPSIYWSTALTCATGCLQSIVIGVSLNGGKSAWLIRTKLQLLTIVYSVTKIAYSLALLNTAATFLLITWAVSKRGPIFPSIFSPLSLIFITIVESFIMNLQITVGRLVFLSLSKAAFANPHTT
ncbi:hypothetical protein Taro_028148 [Colocasia esculenta]|uniref:WAT1-related protein n=1 Tax=Colocasia esculenta TaxID=4460 RepID=A0A843VFS5_COLES|nr:hypothetical protein [Colocasia esculenta]